MVAAVSQSEWDDYLIINSDLDDDYVLSDATDDTDVGSKDESDGINNSEEDDPGLQEEEAKEEVNLDKMSYFLGALLDEYSKSGFINRDFSVMTKEEARRRVENEIEEISTVLPISRDAATVLLLKHKWESTAAYEEWFEDDDWLMLAYPVMDDPKRGFNCGLCLCEQEPNSSAVAALPCGHRYCINCLKDYISESINNGPDCLLLKCPDRKCETAIGREKACYLISSEDKLRYEEHLLNSYVEDRKFKKLKWCPASNCDCVVEYDGSSSSAGKGVNILCQCANRFCWNCLGEAHSPVDCETVAQWLCGPMINPSVSASVMDIYRARWAAEYEALIEAQVSQRMYRNLVRNVGEKMGFVSQDEQKFIDDALSQVMECLGILRWAHVYRYYLWEFEYDGAKMVVFDDMLELAKSVSVRFFKCGEMQAVFKRIKEVHSSSGSEKNFNFDGVLFTRHVLTNRTAMARKIFDLFVRALEKGLHV